MEELPGPAGRSQWSSGGLPVASGRGTSHGPLALLLATRVVKLIFVNL